jgi:hypothetical protein
MKQQSEESCKPSSRINCSRGGPSRTLKSSISILICLACVLGFSMQCLGDDNQWGYWEYSSGSSAATNSVTVPGNSQSNADFNSDIPLSGAGSNPNGFGGTSWASESYISSDVSYGDGYADISATLASSASETLTCSASITVASLTGLTVSEEYVWTGGTGYEAFAPTISTDISMNWIATNSADVTADQTYQYSAYMGSQAEAAATVQWSTTAPSDGSIGADIWVSGEAYTDYVSGGPEASLSYSAVDGNDSIWTWTDPTSFAQPASFAGSVWYYLSLNENDSAYTAGPGVDITTYGELEVTVALRTSASCSATVNDEIGKEPGSATGGGFGSVWGDVTVGVAYQSN